MGKFISVIKIILIVILLAGVAGVTYGLVKTFTSDEPITPDDPDYIAVEDIELNETNIVF